ncbi:MAG: IPT/TIG domain-containing protein, partial [Thermoleophilia bacterium]
MRSRHIPTLILMGLVAAAVLAAVAAGPALGRPSYTSVCSNCHSGTPSGTVTATPGTATPAPGATYWAAVNIGLTAAGDTGYHIAQTDASGTSATWTSAYAGGPGSTQTSYTAAMVAPAVPGTYYYKVWTVKGPPDNSGMARSASYSITVPGPPAPTATLTSLTPGHGLTGATVTIAGTDLGVAGTVSFAGAAATTSLWTATQITCTVPAGLTAGAKSVTVTPTGGTASNSLAFTVDAPPTGDTTPPTTKAYRVHAGGWYSRTLGIVLKATDNEGGAGVASITYAIDGAAPVTVEGASALVTIAVDRVTHANDGPHTITDFATDAAGNVEPPNTLTVNIDTQKPRTKAPRTAKVRRYAVATLRYEVADAAPNGGSAKVVLTVRNRRGDVVKVLTLHD